MQDVKLAEVERSLSRMSRLEMLKLGVLYSGVSLRWYNIVVTIIPVP